MKTLDDFKRYLDLGADKIAINTMVIEQPNFIEIAAERFGSQCVVASIDVRKEANSYRVYYNCGRDPTKWTPKNLAIEVEKRGAGEILLTSIDRDGSLEGYDNELNCSVTKSVGIPVIVCGGAGKWQDFVDGIIVGGADAVGTTNIFHFTETSIKSAKQYLVNRGLKVRL